MNNLGIRIDPVAYSWRQAPIYEGNDIYKLSDGVIVPADINEMKAYLKYRIRILGLNDWVRYDLGEGRVDDFIISIMYKALPLEVVFESYYDAKRYNVGEE